MDLSNISFDSSKQKEVKEKKEKAENEKKEKKVQDKLEERKRELYKRAYTKAHRTWTWIERWNELDDKDPEERNSARYGITRGKVRSDGDIVKIDLHHCKLTGGIHGLLFSIVTLRVISLFGNNLGGVVTDSFNSLPYLNHLDLSFNQFSGEFPESLLECAHLKRIHLENNRFSGSLPENIAEKLPELEQFTGQFNLFSGKLPDFQSCKNLKSLQLHENWILDSISNVKLPISCSNIFLSKNCLFGGATDLAPHLPEESTKNIQIFPQRTTEEQAEGAEMLLTVKQEVEELMKNMGSGATNGYYDVGAGGLVDGSGYYDESGYYYDPSSGMYWDPNTGNWFPAY